MWWLLMQGILVSKGGQSIRKLTQSGRLPFAAVPTSINKHSVIYKVRCRIEKIKPKLRFNFDHPFRMIKRQFGYVKTSFRGFVKITAQVVTLFALWGVWVARRYLLANAGGVQQSL